MLGDSGGVLVPVFVQKKSFYAPVSDSEWLLW